jgi:hypothetical protein
VISARARTRSETSHGPIRRHSLSSIVWPIIAYIDDYKLLMIATLAVVPLLIVFKKSVDRGGGHAVEL